jgi:hypothetical protein
MRLMRKYNIKMVLKAAGYSGNKWMDVAQDRDQWQVLKLATLIYRIYYQKVDRCGKNKIVQKGM